MCARKRVHRRGGGLLPLLVADDICMALFHGGGGLERWSRVKLLGLAAPSGAEPSGGLPPEAQGRRGVLGWGPAGGREGAGGEARYGCASRGEQGGAHASGSKQRGFGLGTQTPCPRAQLAETSSFPGCKRGLGATPCHFPIPFLVPKILPVKRGKGSPHCEGLVLHRGNSVSYFISRLSSGPCGDGKLNKFGTQFTLPGALTRSGGSPTEDAFLPCPLHPVKPCNPGLTSIFVCGCSGSGQTRYRPAAGSLTAGSIFGADLC